MAPVLPPLPPVDVMWNGLLLPEGEGQTLDKGPAFLAQFFQRKPTVQKVRRLEGQGGS